MAVKKIFTLLLLLSLYAGSYAQVDMNSGDVLNSIPLYSFSDGKSGLSESFTLDYRGQNGLRVSEIAGNMGLKWNLIFGGEIVREQRGVADDQDSRAMFTPRPYNNVLDYNHSMYYREDGYDEDYENYFPNGFMYSEFPANITDPSYSSGIAPRELCFMPRFKNNMEKFYKVSRRALADREQDVFSFRIQDRISGRFVIGKNGAITLLDKVNVTITITSVQQPVSMSDIRTAIRGFKVTDDAGYKYYFTDYDVNFEAKVLEGENANTWRETQVTDYRTIQKWHLSYIQAPNNDIINYLYKNEEVQYISGVVPGLQVIEGVESLNVLKIKTKVIQKVIDRVDFPGNRTVSFNYKEGQRQDVDLGLAPLASMVVKYMGAEQQKIEFGYGYFYKKQIFPYDFTELIDNPACLRLCLLKVQKFAGDTKEPAYVFDYYRGDPNGDEKDMVPPVHTLAQDHWGFYNPYSSIDPNISPMTGPPSNSSISEMMTSASSARAPVEGMAKNGLLKSVTNPFGGSVTYEYEQNDGYVTETRDYAFGGGVRVRNVVLKSDDGLTPDIINEYSYLTSEGRTSGWGLETFTYDRTIPIDVVKVTPCYGFGLICDHYKHGGLVEKFSLPSFQQGLKKGVRMVLKKVAEKAAEKAAAAGINSKWSIQFAIAFEFVSTLYDVIAYNNNHIETKYATNYDYYPNQLRNMAGLYYSRVEVRKKSINDMSNGWTVYEFKKPDDVERAIPSLQFPFSSKDRFDYWAYNMPVRTMVYNRDGNMIKDISVDKFAESKTVITGADNISACVLPNKMTSGKAGYFTYTLSASDVTADVYSPAVGYCLPAETNEKAYKNGVKVSEEITKTGYNQDNYPNYSEIPASNGDRLITKIYYPKDYNDISAAISKMKSEHLAIPVCKEQWIKKPDGTMLLAAATITEFQVVGNMIRPDRTYVLETTKPLPESIIGVHNPAQLVRNSTYFKLQSTYKYSTAGNLETIFDKAGKLSSKIYDPTGRYLLAEIYNTQPGKVNYTSFEDDFGGYDGGWSRVNPSSTDPIVKNEVSPTGMCHIKLLAGDGLLAGITNLSSKHILSFWAKGDYTLAGGTLKATAAGLPGWTFYEYEMPPGITTVQINSTGELHLDEVRLYPAHATMSTQTYDKALGKINSICDNRNKIIYNNYDGFGRPTGVRDEKYQLIETTEYHYKNN